MRLILVSSAAAILVGLVACASTGAVNTTYNNVGGGGAGAGGASDSSNSAPSSVTSTGTATLATTTASSSVSSSSASAASSSSVSSSTTASTGAGNVCDFSAPEDCDGAELLTQIDGDQNDDTRIEKGTSSRWFKVLIHEGVSSLISYPQLSYTATLTLGSGADYELYAYPGDSDLPDCATNPLAGVGDPLTVTETWGDTPTSDDSRWYIFEVRYASGTACDAASQWTLTIEGHTDP